MFRIVYWLCFYLLNTESESDAVFYEDNIEENEDSFEDIRVGTQDSEENQESDIQETRVSLFEPDYFFFDERTGMLHNI